MGMEQLRDKKILLFGNEGWLEQYIQRIGASVMTPPTFPNFPTDDDFARLQPDLAVFHVQTGIDAKRVLGLSSGNLAKLAVRVRTTGNAQNLELVNKLLREANVNTFHGIEIDNDEAAFDTRFYVCLLRAIANSTS